MGRFAVVPYQDAEIDDALRLACPAALHVVLPTGRILRAGRAVLAVLDGLGYRRTARILARAPLVWAVEAGYRLVAANRGRIPHR